MRRRAEPRPPLARLTLILAMSAVTFSSASAQAASSRFTAVGRHSAELTRFSWWLVSRAQNKVICVIVIGQEGEPTFEEIADACGADLAQQWRDTPACPYDPARTTPCGGVYLRPAGAAQVVQSSALATKPGHLLWLELPGCRRGRENWVCASQPVLRITAEDIDPSDSSRAILALIGAESSKCLGAVCDVPLRPTPPDGWEISFWSTLTSGGVSQRFSGRLRVVEEPEGAQLQWKVDLLSTQFNDDFLDRCALAWDALPALKDRPSWLVIPDSARGLRTSEPYLYLEQRLAGFGLPSADLAGDGKLLAPAEALTSETTPDTLIAIWQNQFDAAIFEAASTRGLPPRLIKSLFAAESQFWPGSFPDIEEVGLGQLSELGADTIMLWSPPFFAEFCPEILHPDSCSQGYSRMPEEQRAMLRAALLARVNADCGDCNYGLDLPRADRSVSVFAESLVAVCSQTGRMVYNVTQNTPGLVSTYEDLWRLTLATYNAGSGCLAQALTSTRRRSQTFDWSHVAANLPTGCQSAIDYVARVLKEPGVEMLAETEDTSTVDLTGQ